MTVMPMMKVKFLVFAGLLATLPACVVPPKIMVGHDFRGDDKTSKLLIMDTGQINPANKARLFDVFMRLCDIDAQGNETTCKDTKVVTNVVPGTVY